MLIKNNTISSEYINIYSLNNKPIGIPIFQRFYDWKDNEIVQFKEDLLKVLDDPTTQFYFLDFIYYEEDDKIKLADGQQRIVTLNNLIKVIKDIAYEYQIKIDAIELFQISYDIFANDQKYQTHFNKYATAPFKKVYLNLYQFVKDHLSQLNDFIKIIKNNIFIFIKRCANADDAFNIFQQINTGGKPLSKDEVIKTALDQYAIAYDISLDTTKMKDIRQSIISYYKFVSNHYDKNFDNMEIITFLKEHITKNRSTFKKFVDTIYLLKSLNNSPIKFIIDYINRNTLLDVLNILAMKNVNINSSIPHVREIMLPLCMMSIILTFNAGSPTIYRYLLNDVIEDIKNDVSPEKIKNKLIERINADPVTWQISLSDFIDKLGNSSINKNMKKALLIIDVVWRNVCGTINVPNINLEHIYPQKPNYEWASNGWPCNRKEQKELCDNIGNYLLLCELVNKRIQNQYITRKVVEYRNIIAKDIFLQTPMNTVDFSRFEEEQATYIYERQREIAKSIQKNFPLGKVLIKN